ncbi:hypothetical protein HanXRQr2_Chr14g0664351 [Helianthus annuus]|uniref:Uncharacterized protein n=1 Tax=Helianthus annuus TaxID=4232 RepID=A0A9K3ECB9_HELAN|nr:hypothetical protein HanXRQr2_Chr14g0664351 [Helianthus annuus]KAJ0842078.1 hypothetical protein HanPSC8_Chr14g0637591 [Helianthus annuus]
MSQVQGLEGMEYTQSQSHTFKFNFTNGHNHPTLSSLPPMLHNLPGSNGVHAPPPPPPQTNIKPSAPPIPTTPDMVYGYPREFFGFKDHPHGC